MRIRESRITTVLGRGFASVDELFREISYIECATEVLETLSIYYALLEMGRIISCSFGFFLSKFLIVKAIVVPLNL